MLLLAWALTPLHASAAERPNILLILADDLGYSDLGCYGGEIETPHLDGLASSGLRFTQFYNTGRCWPTRAATLSGYYAQQVRRDKLPGIRSGGGGVRPDWAPLLPVLLKNQGYRSYHSGKWHIDGMPIQNGFDQSYYLKDQGRFFNPKTHWENDQALPPVPKDSGFYGTTAIADHAIQTLEDHQQNHADQPFFHYLAFTAPHFPLHALPEDIEIYNGHYDLGWEQIRAERWSRIRGLGLLHGALSPVERDLGPPYHFPEHLKILGDNEVNRPLIWNQLTPSQQQFQANKMELHAAMIHRMDLEIGRVLKQLDAMDARDNTLILFYSDNGASAEIMVRDDGHDPAATPGSAATYLCLGPGWSTVSNTPFRRHKTWTHEGGISTPLIVHWPSQIKDPGAIVRQPAHVIDLVPTLLEVANATAPRAPEAPKRPGQSLLPTFNDTTSAEPRTLWWSHDGHRAFRDGDWKAVAPKGEPWELYNLHADRAESNDLAKERPKRLMELQEQWTHTENEFRALYASED